MAMVHQANGEVIGLVAESLARASDDDPVMAWPFGDATGPGADLGPSEPAHLPSDERFGSTATGQVDLPGGPPLGPMWRDPR